MCDPRINVFLLANTNNLKFAQFILIFEIIDIHEIFSIEWGSHIIRAEKNNKLSLPLSEVHGFGCILLFANGRMKVTYMLPFFNH